jgi:hypothetical protein
MVFLRERIIIMENETMYEDVTVETRPLEDINDAVGYEDDDLVETETGGNKIVAGLIGAGIAAGAGLVWHKRDAIKSRFDDWKTRRNQKRVEKDLKRAVKHGWDGQNVEIETPEEPTPKKKH